VPQTIIDYVFLGGSTVVLLKVIKTVGEICKRMLDPEVIRARADAADRRMERRWLRRELRRPSKGPA
jgi:hypothetical protein